MNNLIKPYQEIETTRQQTRSFAVLNFGVIDGPLSFWSKFRRVISLIVALALTAAGVANLVYSPSLVTAWWSAWVLVLGMGWLYADFIDATPNED